MDLTRILLEKGGGDISTDTSHDFSDGDHKVNLLALVAHGVRCSDTAIDELDLGKLWRLWILCRRHMRGAKSLYIHTDPIPVVIAMATKTIASLWDC